MSLLEISTNQVDMHKREENEICSNDQDRKRFWREIQLSQNILTEKDEKDPTKDERDLISQVFSVQYDSMFWHKPESEWEQ